MAAFAASRLFLLARLGAFVCAQTQGKLNTLQTVQAFTGSAPVSKDSFHKGSKHTALLHIFPYDSSAWFIPAGLPSVANLGCMSVCSTFRCLLSPDQHSMCVAVSDLAPKGAPAPASAPAPRSTPPHTREPALASAHALTVSLAALSSATNEGAPCSLPAPAPGRACGYNAASCCVQASLAVSAPGSACARTAACCCVQAITSWPSSLTHRPGARPC